MTNARKAREIEGTAITLIEERGRTNALAWADHCATRDTDGFWRQVANLIRLAGQMPIESFRK